MPLARAHTVLPVHLYGSLQALTFSLACNYSYRPHVVTITILLPLITIPSPPIAYTVTTERFTSVWLCRHNMKLRSLLEHEAGAPPPAWAAAGTTGLAESDSAVSGAPLWELALLSAHYHPHLSQAAAAVAHIPPQGKSQLCCSHRRYMKWSCMTCDCKFVKLRVLA